MVKANFNFNPKSGPGILITGGILFILVGVLMSKGELTFFGIILIAAGIGLSLHWADIFRRR